MKNITGAFTKIKKTKKRCLAQMLHVDYKTIILNRNLFHAVNLEGKNLIFTKTGQNFLTRQLQNTKWIFNTK